MRGCKQECLQPRAFVKTSEKRRELPLRTIDNRISALYICFIVAIHGGKTGENTTGCFIPGDSFEPNKKKSNYVINNNQKKEELFRFFDNYGHNGIKINVGPDLEDWYK